MDSSCPWILWPTEGVTASMGGLRLMDKLWLSAYATLVSLSFLCDLGTNCWTPQGPSLPPVNQDKHYLLSAPRSLA